MAQEFDAKIVEKYGKLKTVKSFTDLCLKAYDNNLEGLLKFLIEKDDILESNMLTEMSNENVSEFVNKYGINPEILLRLLTALGDSLVEPLVEGYYDATNDFGHVTNSAYRAKQRKKKAKKAKVKSSSRKAKIKPKRKKKNKRAQTDALYAAKQQKPSTAISPLSRGRAHQKHQQSRAKSPQRPSVPSQKAPSAPHDTNQESKIEAISHELLRITSLEAYLDDYALKFVFFNEHPKQSLTYPQSWTCLYYHQMGADLEFDALEDVTNEAEKTNILWKEWHDKHLNVSKTEYDSDDNKSNDNEDEDALLTQVPDFIYDFYKDIHHSYDIYTDNNNNKHRLYTYRIRRWISADLQEEESKKIPNKFRGLPRYSWIADTVSYLDDYMLTDDLIVIQNCNLLQKPTRYHWLQPNRNNSNGLDFIRDSGFFKNKDKSGIYSVIDKSNKMNILECGVCAIGDFKFGIQPTDDDLDLYGIIRLDVLVPSLLHFPLYMKPMMNIGKYVVNNNVMSLQTDCKAPIIQNGGLCFDNMQRYENQRTNKDVAIRLNLKPIIAKCNDEREDIKDAWSMFICFAHPVPNKEGERSIILFKKHCLDLSIENEYDEDGQILIKEELVLKIFSMNSGSRYIEIFRKKIKSNDAQCVNALALTFDGQNKGKLFCALNGRQLTLTVERLSRTNLLNMKKSSLILIGHKCSSGDVGSVQNLFNGYVFQLCIYPKCFREFELRAFGEQSQLHIKKYRQLLNKY